jgi:hypothetical protein
MRVGARFNSQKGFFDRKAVIDALGPAKAKNLQANTALVKKIMQQSMRYRKKASAAGTPPSAHKTGRGPKLRKFLFNSWDASTGSAVVGPEKLTGAPGDAPRLQNEGGTIQRRVIVRKPGKKAKSRAQAEAYRRGIQSGRIPKPPRVTKTITLAARPYTTPALEKAKPKLTAPWADSVKP